MNRDNRGIFWEDAPASQWLEAFPIGNGRQGAMIFGGFSRERIQLNLDSLWYGGHVDRVNPAARENLKTVQELILAGKIAEAEEKLVYYFSGLPQSQRPYQSLGDLTVSYGSLRKPWRPEEMTDYCRELRLEDGIVRESFVREGWGRLEKQYFASWPAKVIVITLKLLPENLDAEAGGCISFSALLRRERFYEHAGRLDDHTIFMSGQSGPDGVKFYTAVSAVVEDGIGELEDCGGQAKNCSGRSGDGSGQEKHGSAQVEVAGEHLLVRGCRQVTLFIAGETSFYEADPAAAVRQRLQAAEKLGAERLLKEHQEDYRRLFDRVHFSLGAEASLPRSEESSLRTGEKSAGNNAAGSCAASEHASPAIPLHRRRAEHPEDPRLAETYFQYCRYLMISGSRPDSLPLNLQGIWNEEMQPAWDSKYTININTEMNYWPAESCNLVECSQPLFGLIKRMVETGKDTARRMYGCRGFTAHHNTDIWADTAPQDIYIPATYWVMGGAWLCTHIMRSYRYTRDEEFLRQLYPCLEEAVLFFEDFLIEDGGELVTCPSVSPENTYIMEDGTEGCICAGSTMDVEILRDLFGDYLEAAEILGIQNEISQRAEAYTKRFPKLKIGRHGQIQEWREDYEEKEPGHRHISQLYGLYPSVQISRDRTPELAEAAAKTLERRLFYGGGHTGWSCAWIVCLYARLENGEKAYQNLKKLFLQSTAPNLMDTHPRRNGCVFQIDGNMGALAGMTEMLVHGEQGFVKLLPALPKAWKDGQISGIRIMDGGELSMEWKDGQVSRYEIQAGDIPLSLTLAYNGICREIRLCAGVRFTGEAYQEATGAERHE